MEKLRNASKQLRPGALTLLRVTVGVIMVVHGWLKLTGYEGWQQNLAGMGVPLPEIAAPLAVAGELAGGVGLILGALTPVAAFGVLCVMLVAIFQVHLGNGLLAKNGGFEYPLTLAVISLFFIVRGGGPISVDRLIFGRKKARDERTPPRERGWREAPA